MKRPAPKAPALKRLPPVRRNGTELLDHLAEHLSLSRSADFPEVPRQMLHASELRFAHPQNGKMLTASAPLPKDFRDWMHTLRLT